MGIKSIFAKPFAAVVARGIRQWSDDALRCQEFIFHKLIQSARKTSFGKQHGFSEINNYEDFKLRVPIRDYELMQNEIDRIKNGENDVNWPGKPIYLAKSSGTTSGIKYIPISKDSIANHIDTARNALLNYINETGRSQFVNGKMIFLSGSPVLENVNEILTGRLSGIVNHHVPKYLKGNQLPTYKTNCIEDWEEKVDAIVKETMNEDLTLVSGIPPWVQMYFDKLLLKTGKKTVREVFPNLNLLVYGGVSFEPYRKKMFDTIGEEIDSIETYPASEGFIAFQNAQNEKGLLLNVDSGIYFEFIDSKNVFDKNPERKNLSQVETGINYALVINSNAGLWGYLIGDTVKFISLKPYKILVTGRIKHFISAFGEHVIGEEVEKAMNLICDETGVSVIEFTVAPQVNPSTGLPYHEWFIEFGIPPDDLISFSNKLDAKMQEANIYYRDLIAGKILKPLVISEIKQNGFREMMKASGKLGGQNKVPRLSNDREIANQLSALLKN